MDPRKIQKTHSAKNPSFFNNMFDLVGFAYVFILRDSHFSFFNFHISKKYQEAMILNYFSRKAWEEPIVLDPRDIQNYSSNNQ